jgi:hypothetical protein
MTEALRSQIRRRVPAIGCPRSTGSDGTTVDSCVPICWPGCVVAALAVPQGPRPSQGPGGTRTVHRSACPHRVRGLRHLASTGGRTCRDRLGDVGIPCCRPPVGQWAQAVLFTTAATLWGEIVLIVAAQLRIGWVAEFLSKPIVTGFLLLTGKP